MDIVEDEYKEFAEWLANKPSFVGFTQSQQKFAKQMFEIMFDFPSFKAKLTELGGKQQTFALVEQYVKEKNK